MGKFYLGLDYYNPKDDVIIGSMSWDYGGKSDMPYDSKQDLVRDVVENAIQEDIETIEMEEEVYIPIYSLEVKKNGGYKVVEYYISNEHIERFGINESQVEKLRKHIKAQMVII